MTSNKEFQIYILEDLLGGDTAYTTRAMFGSIMLYKHGIPLGIIDKGVLYIKVFTNRALLSLEQKESYFSYNVKGKEIILPYTKVPDEDMESPEHLQSRIEYAYQCASATKK